MSAVGAPSGRFSHTALWTGAQMLVFGGAGSAGYLTDTYSYTPTRELFVYLKP